MNSPSQTVRVDRDDIQGLLRSGYGQHTEACFVLLRIRDRSAARAWLAVAPVTSAAMIERPAEAESTGQAQAESTVPAQPLLETVLQIALSSEGLRALGVAEDIVDSFSEEFVSGMSGDDNRLRRLGDVKASAPSEWRWGAGERVPHVLVMLYALPGHLDGWWRTIQGQLGAGFDTLACLPTSTSLDAEPFGFKDGLSQPRLDWERQRPARDEDQLTYSNLSCLGEFLLGYPNEYGGYTARPLLDAQRDTQALLPRAEDEPDKFDLGRNGSYLVMRQLRQDVDGFWQFLDNQAGGDPIQRDRLAAAMVGRTRQGAPLVGSTSPSDLNSFTFQSDTEGLRCPFGAHIRRTNPRNADLPAGGHGIVSRLIRTLGFDARALQQDRVASTRFHRLLRRGRKYDPAPSATESQGLYFICLGANIARQFEFVQSAWLIGTKFDGLNEQSDPLLGTRESDSDGTRTDNYSMPQADGPDRRVTGLPQFVTVLGGAYFFLPGIRALRYLAQSALRGSR